MDSYVLIQVACSGERSAAMGTAKRHAQELVESKGCRKRSNWSGALLYLYSMIGITRVKGRKIPRFT